METLRETIKTNKPNITDSSVNSYASVLTNLHKKIFPDTEFKIEDFNNAEKVLDFLKDQPVKTRKTKLSAIATIVSNPLYSKQMEQDTETTMKEQITNKKNPKQEANSVDLSDITKLLGELKREADHVYKKAQLTLPDLQVIQNYILLVLTGGVFFPPRRSKDWADMKIADINKETDNYIEKKEFVFNSYKTAKHYKQQREAVPKAVQTILTKWIKHNPTPFLLFDSNMGQLTPVKITQRLNKLFGDKKISTSALRHTYLTDKYGGSINLINEVAQTLASMGSSPAVLNDYVKL
tara:strand:+ start:75 stop:956 length:882 start_codon:yes stop_codon:yes gene_type:complete